MKAMHVQILFQKLVKKSLQMIPIVELLWHYFIDLFFFPLHFDNVLLLITYLIV